MGRRGGLFALVAVGRAAVGLSVLALGCAQDQNSVKQAEDSGEPLGVCAAGGPSTTYVIQQLRFARNEGGVSWGSDLDGEVTPTGSTGGCGKPDLTDPEGRPGIDNAFAGLLPAIEQTEGAAISALLQDSIRAGELLLTFELLGLDDLENDACIDVQFGNASGSPLLGTDGELLAGQSYLRDPSVAPSRAEAVVVEGGRLIFRADFGIKLQILTAELDLLVTQGEARLDLAPDGSGATGHITGAVHIQTMLDEIDKHGIDQGLKDLIHTVLPAIADLKGPEGTCDHFSLAFEFDAVPAFYYLDDGLDAPTAD